MATNIPGNPLTDQHLDDINTALAKLDLARQQIVLAKAAGIDTAQLESDERDARASLTKIKQVYFPGR
jgi:hypothetical protein